MANVVGVAREFVCQDCSAVLEHLKVTGCVPKRCESCRKALAYARKRQWYRENRETVLTELRARRLNQEKIVTCPDCGDGRSVPMYRGLHETLLCSECRTISRLAVKARYRERHREELRAKGRKYEAKRRAEDPEYAERGRERIRTLMREQPEYLAEIRKRSYWKHAESRRARRREHQIRHRLAIYERDDGICHICGEAVPNDWFEIDHVIPVSRGGSSAEANLALAHFRCNRRKAARLLEELVV